MNRAPQSLPSSQPAGWFVGTCANATVSETANLLLLIHGGTATRVHGELSLFGELGGGGPFHGRVNGQELRFTTCLPLLQTVVEWHGQRTESGLAGTYQVCCDLPEVVTADLSQQRGHWSCVQVNHADDTGQPGAIWVFHDGQSEGPLSEAEFLRRAHASRWPPHALAAREKGTSWNTVGGLCDLLEASRLALN